MMKKHALYVLTAALLLLTAACRKDPDTGASIVGAWELYEVVTKSATIGSEEVNVYIEFGSDGTFALYQQLGADRYEAFSGTYTYSADVLSGKYSTGDSLASTYTVELTEETLDLTTEGGGETDRYVRISAIPDEVIAAVLK